MLENSNLKDMKRFIKTLEIHDVIMVKSEHTVNELYINKGPLHVDLSHVGENKVVVKDNFIIFEMSMQLKILETESAEKSLVESSASFAAIYTFENEENIRENAQALATHFFQYAATTHMIAFARKYFFDVLINSGYPRLLIPLVKSGLDEETENAASDHFNNQ